MAPRKTTKRKVKKAANRKVAKPILHTPKNAIRRRATAAGATAGLTGAANSGGSMSQSPLYYDYRWSTPDKFYFPRSRAVSNRIWREVYIRDPVVSVGTDVFSELPWSKFDLAGIDDKSVFKIYQDMFNELNLVPKLNAFTKDFLITGELILHHIFDNTKGYWTRVISHNPDFVRVEGIGLVVDQPLMWLKPTPEIKRLINSTDPRVAKLRKLLPRSIINSFRMNREVPLSPLNTLYMPRTVTSQSIRGVSLYTRLFRIIMYEDFVVNASLAVAQRHAAPLRIFKLGDPQSGWEPTPDDIENLSQMLSIAESDPMAAIIMHQHLDVELVGIQDRVLLVSREWDFIERVKLLALGMAKSFLVGEQSYASAYTGLQTLLERLSALRLKFENDWFIKKLCKPVAEMNEFYRRSQSELDHRIRIQRPEEERELLVPEIKWRKALEPTQDTALLNVWDRLHEYGIISDRTFASGAGVDIDQERKNVIEEHKYKKDVAEEYGIPAEEKTPGGGAPMPPPPAPAAASAKTGRNIRSEDVNALDDIIDELENLSDIKGNIHIDDVSDTLRNIFIHHQTNVNKRESELLDRFEKTLPKAGNELLSGV